jgi:hypothetical protein
MIDQPSSGWARPRPSGTGAALLWRSKSTHLGGCLAAFDHGVALSSVRGALLQYLLPL